MKRLLVALGVVAVAGLLGVMAAWACCGGGIVIDIMNVVDAPDPVCATGTTTISFDVAIQMDDMGGIEPNEIWARVDIKDGATVIATLGPKKIGEYTWDNQVSPQSASFSWAPSAADAGKTYTYAIEAWSQNAADPPQTAAGVLLPEAGSITIIECCPQGIVFTPQTFDVARAGVPVMAHMVLAPGAPLVTGGRIIKIGDIAVAIEGTATPDTNLTFSSAAFSEKAALIVAPGGSRTNVEVRIEVDQAPGAVGCSPYYTDSIDIINQGKGKKK